MVWPGKHGMVYDMALQAWHGLCIGLVGMAWYIWYCLAGLAWYIVCPCGHGMVYGNAWRGMGLHMVWLGRMTCIWYGLAGMACYMVWSIGYVMIYDVVWRAWHGNWYGLVGIAWYIALAWYGLSGMT